MVMPRRHLTGFRVQGVYSPAVIRALTRPLTELGLGHAPRLWPTRQQAEDIAAAWRALPLAAHADDGSFTTAVPDPPPLQITREGRTWYLAHFNAHRAVSHRAGRQPSRRPPADPGRRRCPAAVVSVQGQAPAPVQGRARSAVPRRGRHGRGRVFRFAYAVMLRLMPPASAVHNLVRRRRGLRA